MSRFLLVTLVEDLTAERTTRYATFLGLEQVPGVKSVTDLSVISREILDEWLLPAGLSLVRKKKGGRRGLGAAR